MPPPHDGQEHLVPPPQCGHVRKGSATVTWPFPWQAWHMPALHVRHEHLVPPPQCGQVIFFDIIAPVSQEPKATA